MAEVTSGFGGMGGPSEKAFLRWSPALAAGPPRPLAWEMQVSRPDWSVRSAGLAFLLDGRRVRLRVRVRLRLRLRCRDRVRLRKTINTYFSLVLGHGNGRRDAS